MHNNVPCMHSALDAGVSLLAWISIEVVLLFFTSIDFLVSIMCIIIWLDLVHGTLVSFFVVISWFARLYIHGFLC